MKTSSWLLPLLLFISSELMAEQRSPQAPLDQALVEASRPGEIDRSFYNAFLRSTLYLPTHGGSGVEQNYRAESGHKISPIFIQSGENQFLMLFDSAQRLGNWAGREVNYTALPGHAIVEMMSTEFHWYLNHGTPFGKEFVPEEIEWIKNNLDSLRIETSVLKGGEPILVGRPKEIPEGIVEALIEISRRNTEVSATAFGQVFIEGVTEKPALSIAIQTDEVEESVLNAIKHDFTITAQGLVPSGTEFLIFVVGQADTASTLFEAVGPIYTR